jgi:hypothetical protein
MKGILMEMRVKMIVRLAIYVGQGVVNLLGAIRVMDRRWIRFIV